jgi:hypothetical protein
MSYSRLVAVALLLFSAVAGFAADKLTLDELTAKHLESIGTPQARSAPDGREFDGVAVTRIIVGGTGTLQGPAALISKGQDVRITMTFPDKVNYPGEDFVKAGDHKPVIVPIRSDVRSSLGNFLEFYPEPLREGLMGSVLSTAWPLYDQQVHGAKLKIDGLKNVDGQKLYQVSYHPAHSSGNVQIFLYFDPETMRHVMSRYSVTAQMGGFGLNQSGGRNQATILEERFSEFRQVNGLMLPLKWDIRWTREQGRMEAWEIIFQKLKPTVANDAFELKK